MKFFLSARDHLMKIEGDGNSFKWEKDKALNDYYDSRCKLEEAHKISLMDIIKGEE